MFVDLLFILITLFLTFEIISFTYLGFMNIITHVSNQVFGSFFKEIWKIFSIFHHFNSLIFGTIN